MLINPIREFKPLKGDDLPYFSMRLRDVPNGYHITDIEIDQDLHPKTYLIKDRLLGMTESYYRNFEVNGETLQDFKENIQMSYNLNADTFEKILSYYPSLDMMIGSNTTESIIKQNNRSSIKNDSSVSSEQSTDSGNTESSKNKNVSDSKTNDSTEINDIKSNSVSTSSNSSKENKTSNSSYSESGSNDEIGNVSNSENEKTNGNRTNNKKDVSVQSEIENNRFNESNQTGRSVSRNEELNKNSVSINDSERSLDRNNEQHKNTNQTKNSDHKEISVSLDSNNLNPHNRVLDDQTDNSSDDLKETYSENENNKNNDSVSENNKNSVTETETNTGSVENITDKNKSNSSQTTNDENENINNESQKTKSEVNNKNSQYEKTNSNIGTDISITDENENASDLLDSKENRKRSESEINTGTEYETFVNSDSSNSVKDTTKTGNENIEENENYSETRTKNIDRIGNEQMIDIFDNFIKKYPNILKIFIGYFKDDFVIYQAGYF